MNERDIEAIVERTVTRTLVGIGFNTENPTEIQKDISYLRKIRISSESLSLLIRNTTVGIVVTGLAYGFLETLKMSINK